MYQPHLLTKVRSKEIMRGTHGRNCSLRICSLVPGRRCWGNDTVVPCHTDGIQKGTNTKTSDLFVVAGCFACHQILDGVDLEAAEYIRKNCEAAFQKRIRAALVETQSIHVREGLIIIPKAVLV